MSRKKKILAGLGVAAGAGALLIVVGVVLLIGNLDTVVRVGTEEALTYALKVPVTIDKAEVHAAKGTIGLHGINIPNPPGYASDHAMKFGEIHVEADIKSFRTDEPTIRLIRISEPDIIYERKLKTSNLDDLIANASSAEEEQTSKPGRAPEESRKKLKIDKVVVAGSTVKVTFPAANGKTLSVKTPDVEINNLGGNRDRVTTAEAMQEILTAIITSVKDAGPDVMKSMEDSMKDTADSLKKKSSETSEKLKRRLEEHEKKIQDILRKRKKDQ